MYIEVVNKSRSLGGASDLTVMAPIRKGLVPSLESITYKSRVKRLLQALQLLRESSHEYSPFRGVSDSGERVGLIHSFRVAIVEPEDKLLLSVTFDGAQASYERVLWQKIGTLLDVLFCSTDNYVPAYGNPLAAWSAWIDSVQVDTDFFYSRPGLTSEDVVFLRDDERQRRSTADLAAGDLASVRRHVVPADQASWNLQDRSLLRTAEAFRQGMQALVLLHRLSAYFIPGTPDGDFLHRAARDLLPELRRAQETGRLDDSLRLARKRFEEPIDWFFRGFEPRQVPAPPTRAPDAPLLARVQGGVLEPYAGTTHGALLLLAFRPDVDAAALWRYLQEAVTRGDRQPADGSLVCNVAFTAEGLRAAGLPLAVFDGFPLEFREGMAARSSVLGDLRINHPRRWRVPVRNWRAGVRAGEVVELAGVHLVIQLRIGNPPGQAPAWRCYDLEAAAHPLRQAMADLESRVGDCMELLSREPMVRHLADPADPASPIREHFGFVDRGHDPLLDPVPASKYRIYRDTLIHPGEVLAGHTHAAEEAAPAGAGGADEWLADGTFLALRKLRQDVGRFNEVVRGAAAAHGVTEDLVAAKMLGRTREGDALADPDAQEENDFDYEDDPDGAVCPLHAHIRRANPRISRPVGAPPVPPGERPPRIMRRSMSYGPRFDAQREGQGAPPVDRGMYFMAYNASLAEQFEVIQRWLAGGNSTGGLSAISDPFIGVPVSGQQRMFVFECPVPHADGSLRPGVVRVPLDGRDDLPEDLSDPLVRLEWGLYLFTPSLAALGRLAALPRQTGQGGMARWPWSIERGRREIERLRGLGDGGGDTGVAAQAWKATLEDPESQRTFLAASVWASIRVDHGGVLRTPYGVIVAGREQVEGVLYDDRNRYSVAGYRERSMPTIGDIYLGLDDVGPGCPYRRHSREPNEAIMSLTREQAFELARRLAGQALQRLVDLAIESTLQVEPRWELTFSSREVVDRTLAGICQQWFGLPADGPLIAADGLRWDWRPGDAVLYPGHFVSPSRYIFQPNPADEVLRIGTLHGRSLRTAFIAWVREVRAAGATAVPAAPDGRPAALSAAIFNAFPRPAPGADPLAVDARDVQVADTVLGALIGFLPTVDGNLRQSLNEWLGDGTFWALRAALTEQTVAFGSKAFGRIESALRRSMQLRPVSELLWRRATTAHAIGGVSIEAGDKVVVSLVSGCHELLEQGREDVSLVFGGRRARDRLTPTHACPAYEAAFGVMLGVLTALVETRQPLRPTPAALSFRIEGAMPTPSAAASAPVASPAASSSPGGAPAIASAAASSAPASPAAAPPGPAPSIPASPAAVEPPQRTDPPDFLETLIDAAARLVTTLRDGSPTLEGVRGHAPAAGPALSTAAAPRAMPEDLSPTAPPMAFYTLRDAPAGAGAGQVVDLRLPGLSLGRGQEFILVGDSWLDYLMGDGLEDQLRRMFPEAVFDSRFAESGTRLSSLHDQRLAEIGSYIDRRLARNKDVAAVLLSAGGNDVTREDLYPVVKPRTVGPELDDAGIRRVVVQGMGSRYRAILSMVSRFRRLDGSPLPVLAMAYDYPVPFGKGLVLGSPWLKPYLDVRGYVDLAEATEVMRLLIDALNDTLAGVCGETAFSGFAIHADLRRTLSNSLADYRRDWENELHPTDDGFRRLAERLAESYLRKVARP